MNAMLMNGGEKMHYMTYIGVQIGNVTLFFDTHRKSERYLATLNAKLAPVGAKASGDEYHTHIVLCDGQRVTIVQMHVASTYFLNVEYDTPGCHDELRGILGQLFQCKYGSSFVLNCNLRERLFFSFIELDMQLEKKSLFGMRAAKSRIE